jgi:hypothetical protein
MSHSKQNSARRYHKCKYVLMLNTRYSFRILERNLSFLDRYSTKGQRSSFIKMRPVGTELFLANGQTDRRTDGKTERLIVTFRNYANAPNTAAFCHTGRVSHPNGNEQHFLLQNSPNGFSDRSTSCLL